MFHPIVAQIKASSFPQEAPPSPRQRAIPATTRHPRHPPLFPSFPLFPVIPVVPRHSRESGNPDTFMIEVDSRFRGNDGVWQGVARCLGYGPPSRGGRAVVGMTGYRESDGLSRRWRAIGRVTGCRGEGGLKKTVGASGLPSLALRSSHTRLRFGRHAASVRKPRVSCSERRYGQKRPASPQGFAKGRTGSWAVRLRSVDAFGALCEDCPKGAGSSFRDVGTTRATM